MANVPMQYSYTLSYGKDLACFRSRNEERGGVDGDITKKTNKQKKAPADLEADLFEYTDEGVRQLDKIKD